MAFLSSAAKMRIISTVSFIVFCWSIYSASTTHRRVCLSGSTAQCASPLQASLDKCQSGGRGYPIFVNFDVDIYEFRHFSIMLAIWFHVGGSRRHGDTQAIRFQ